MEKFSRMTTEDKLKSLELMLDGDKRFLDKRLHNETIQPDNRLELRDLWDVWMLLMEDGWCYSVTIALLYKGVGVMKFSIGRSGSTDAWVFEFPNNDLEAYGYKGDNFGDVWRFRIPKGRELHVRNYLQRQFQIVVNEVEEVEGK